MLHQVDIHAHSMGFSLIACVLRWNLTYALLLMRILFCQLVRMD